MPAVPDASMVPQALPADVGNVIAFEVRVQTLSVQCRTVCRHDWFSQWFSLRTASCLKACPEEFWKGDGCGMLWESVVVWAGHTDQHGLRRKGRSVVILEVKYVDLPSGHLCRQTRRRAIPMV